MKYKFFITILAVLTLTITSCSKSKPPLDTSPNNVSATITIGNNAPVQFSITGAAAMMYPLMSDPSTYHIEASTESTDLNHISLAFGLDTVTQIGTYPFTANDHRGNGLTVEYGLGPLSETSYSTSDPSITNKGSVTITVLNKHHIEGFFIAFCKNDSGEIAAVSNGSFRGNF